MDNSTQHGAPLVIPVDAERLNQSLKTVFLGVAGVFDSLGLPKGQAAEAQKQAVDAISRMTADSTAESVNSPAPAAADFPDPYASETPPWDSAEDETETEPPHESVPKAMKPSPAPLTPAPTLTIDDITHTVVKKIQANRKNTEKIGKLVKTYGLETLKQLPPEDFEDFMTDLAQI